MKKFAALLTIIVFLLLASCTTTKGSLFKQVLSSSPPSEGSTSVAVQPSDTKPEQVGLEVQTTPSDAQVYLNDVFIGDTPIVYTDFRAGTYKITISKRGYYDTVRWLNLDPKAYTLVQSDLSPKVGYLSVSVSPAIAQVTVDGNVMPPGVEQIAVGPHTVRVTAFGYEDWQQTVDVQENQTVDIRAALQKASFRVTQLTASRKVLNPLNPGLLGDVLFGFQVSTYGEGSLSVENSEGKTLFRHVFPRFTERNQFFRWDGRSQTGALLPNGRYHVTVTGSSGREGTESTQSIPLTISRGALIGLRSVLSGTSGLLYAGTPEVLPPSSFSVSSLLLAHFESAGSIVPIQFSFRAVPYRQVEVDGQALAQLKSTSSVPVSVGLAGKYAFLQPDTGDGFSAAVSLKGTYLMLTASDTFTNFSGISVGVPIEYRIGPFGIVAMPEVIAAPYAATYTTPPSSINPTFWGYGRGGIFLDFGSLVTGISAAVRTRPFREGLGLATIPFAGGWEIHWLIPGTQLVLTGAVAGEYSPDPQIGFYGMAGAGIGFVN